MKNGTFEMYNSNMYFYESMMLMRMMIQQCIDMVDLLIQQ